MFNRKGRGGDARSEKPLLASCSLCHFSWGKKPWEAKGVLYLGVGEESLCTCHSPNKATLCIPHFKLCMLLFLFLALFLLLIAGLSFCQKTVCEREEGAAGREGVWVSAEWREWATCSVL